ncbi:MAG: HAMP domain-containing protein [Deltaproteobacteria bacterium]|nr:HAMP domain-containing protein [Deltaproteobacteria bacterium]
MANSLQQRLMFFVLIPIAFLLFLIGSIGFLYARNTMLSEWREAAVLKLQRGAHQMDMRLSRPLEWIRMFQQSGELLQTSIQDWLISRLQQLGGVESAHIEWFPEYGGAGGTSGDHMGAGTGKDMNTDMKPFQEGGVARITPPKLDSTTGKKTVTIESNLLDRDNRTVGQLQVIISFEYLLEGVLSSSWTEGDKACLVDENGAYLAHTAAIDAGRRRLGGAGDSLELAILEALKDRPFGTVLGRGHPPGEVAGFCRLQNAPWTIVVFAPGDKILGPIVRFRTYFFGFGIICIGIVLMLIRLTTAGTVRSIQEISASAKQVASGDYGRTLSVRSRDEVGQLTRSFNTMIAELRQKERIRNMFGRYVDKEVAEELLRGPESTRLGGEKREVVILMSDLRGFTPLCEAMSPEIVIGVLNRYFSYIIGIIHRYKGIIIDFVGDAVLVFFDPITSTVDEKAKDAVQCGLEMQSAMERVNDENQGLGIPRLSMGIGIHSGEVIVGNIGSQSRAKYGIVGAPVNLTQRIQSVAEGGEVVVSESVRRRTGEAFRVLRSFKTRLKGVHDQVTLHVVDGSVEVGHSRDGGEHPVQHDHRPPERDGQKKSSVLEGGKDQERFQQADRRDPVPSPRRGQGEGTG